MNSNINKRKLLFSRGSIFIAKYIKLPRSILYYLEYMFNHRRCLHLNGHYIRSFAASNFRKGINMRRNILNNNKWILFSEVIKTISSAWSRFVESFNYVITAHILSIQKTIIILEPKSYQHERKQHNLFSRWVEKSSKQKLRKIVLNMSQNCYLLSTWIAEKFKFPLTKYRKRLKLH